jgi:hypothetical protein
MITIACAALLGGGLIAGCGSSQQEAGVQPQQTDPQKVLDDRGDLEKEKCPVLDAEAAERQVSVASSRFFDAVQVRGRMGENTALRPISVSDPTGRKADDLYAYQHDWQIDDLPVDVLQPAIERLNAYLVSAGWTVTDFSLPPKVPSATVTAVNPVDGTRVYAKGFAPMKRVFFTVTTSCLRVPPGQKNPVRS